ncbi:PilZ domain-containing protein [Caminibacter pacificus]|uniref:HlyD family efflux transporter periplasmic adaptor subunit n=1 Tax=Caminibacter pacificus TaxID=1424653 RepID=A0AAJ4RCV8_9BACT|nr:PilZ domain-containing protein [Caminibacter pacificus]QCI27761.1 HlyD family efflux transporter periplasmic adaptor subunit [Caminibacter pacificus]ROR40064.1 HlyD family secretion protein [Caminibacter pacificus]
MAQYTDKAKQIVHEAEITRQHARYKIPATIEIEGKKYKVYDWSVSGVGIIGLPDEIYNKKHVVAKMIFKFDDFETVIDNLHLEFVSKRPDGVVGARFTELTPQQIAILNQIISAYLAGDIVTEDDIIHAVTRANFMEKKETKPKVDKKKSILVLLLLWFFVIVLILFLLFVMYQRIYIVKSENAFFDANMTIIRAPSPSYIEFAKDFKVNQEVNTSEVLMYAHIMYGGVKVVKSPLNGTIFKIMIHNGDFRNVGEPVFAVLEKNYEIYIVANVLHKDLVKIRIGDIAKVQLPNGDRFYARVSKIEFPYNVVEEHARPLENIYNQARNYDKVILKPINYKPSTDLISTSAVITIDTLLNKYDWYSIKEEKQTSSEPEKKQVTESQNQDEQAQENFKADDNNANEINNEIQKEKNVQETTNNEKTLTEETKEKEVAEVQTNNEPQTQQETQEVVYENKYCIIAASSPRPFNDRKSKEFLNKFTNAKVVKVGKIYEIKIESFDSYKQAKSYVLNNVKKYYKDAFIIKCKVKKND